MFVVIPRMRASKIPMNELLDIGPSLQSFYKLVITDLADYHDP